MKRIIMIVAIIVGLLAALFIYLASSSGHQTLNKLATPALQRNTQNTERQNDVAKIDAAVSSFISDHNGSLPQSTATDQAASTLDICGADCMGTDKVTVALDYYKNNSSAVSFHSYASNLAVPNTSTIYIVNNANCNSNKNGIGSQTTNSQYVSVAFLYALEAGSGSQQQCLGF